MICDSISPEGIRLCTLQLRYPYIIHGELMTHRVFSRNASSTRAIPVRRMIQSVKDDPFIPLVWTKNEPGMQGRSFMSLDEVENASRIWMEAMENAVSSAYDMAAIGAHKQIANRLLLPFMHIDVVVTSTHWANWDALRIHEDAEPHIQILAKEIFAAREGSKPIPIRHGEWHLPYITYEDWNNPETHGHKDPEFLLKMSTARCAWVSYVDPLGKKATIGQEVDLHDRLVLMDPVHASPAEHQATPDVRWTGRMGTYGPDIVWQHPEEHGNFFGWRQYRKTLPNESVKDWFNA